MTSASLLDADLAWPLWDDQPIARAFVLDQPGGDLKSAVVLKVERPWLFGYSPKQPNGRAVLILGGGGYTQLMVGREGIAIARWFTSLGFHAFVLVHRFPTAELGPQAPLDDARRSLSLIASTGLASSGIGVCGLSSGGHLAAALLSHYPVSWTPAEVAPPTPKFAIISYAPISTNAVGRTIISGKEALEPPAKQSLYNAVQPDEQLLRPAPPTFIVYSGNDHIVPVVNAHRLAQGITDAGGTVELHIFADAPHGFAIDTKGLPVSKWPSLCEAWMQQNWLLGL
jgi:acetyl esterase/lipase